MLLGFISAIHGQNDMVTHELRFHGKAKGGELVFFNVPPSSFSVSIKTLKGETAPDVVTRLADALNKDGRFLAHNGGQKVLGKHGVLGPLNGYAKAGLYSLAGTESGLGIPQSSPHSLSLTYDFQSDKLVLSWEEHERFDSIGICINGIGMPNFPGKGTTRELTKVSEYPQIYPLDNLHVNVVGYLKGIPSNVASMCLKGNRQQGVWTVPFNHGVMTNWNAWSSGQARAVSFEETRYKGNLNAQAVSVGAGAEGSAYACGTWRLFSNLKKSRYRIGVDFKLPHGISPKRCQLLVAPVGEDRRWDSSDFLRDDNCRILFDWTDFVSEDWRTFRTGTKQIPDIELGRAQSIICWIRIQGSGSQAVNFYFSGLYLEEITDDN